MLKCPFLHQLYTVRYNYIIYIHTCNYIYIYIYMDMFINMRQFLAILWTFELLLHFDQLFSSNLQSGD